MLPREVSNNSQRMIYYLKDSSCVHEKKNKLLKVLFGLKTYVELIQCIELGLCAFNFNSRTASWVFRTHERQHVQHVDRHFNDKQLKTKDKPEHAELKCRQQIQNIYQWWNGLRKENILSRKVSILSAHLWQQKQSDSFILFSSDWCTETPDTTHTHHTHYKSTCQKTQLIQSDAHSVTIIWALINRWIITAWGWRTCLSVCVSVCLPVCVCVCRPRLS